MRPTHLHINSLNQNLIVMKSQRDQLKNYPITPLNRAYTCSIIIAADENSNHLLHATYAVCLGKPNFFTHFR
jgi:hypothetical protein